MNSANWQDALWVIPNYLGTWGWQVPIAIVALVSAIASFHFVIAGQKFSLILIGRSLRNIGLIDIALRPLNSGWLEWGVLTMVLGSFLITVSIALKWDRKSEDEKRRYIIYRIFIWIFRIFLSEERYGERTTTVRPAGSGSHGD